MCKSEDWVIFFFTTTVTWILMCHIFKKNDNLMCKVRSEIPDGCAAVHTYANWSLNWNYAASISAGSRVGTSACTCTASNALLHKGIHLEIFHWQAPWWLTGVSLLNHSCWDPKPISSISASVRFFSQIPSGATAVPAFRGMDGE